MSAAVWCLSGRSVFHHEATFVVAVVCFVVKSEPYNDAPVYSVTIGSNIRRMHVRRAVTCHQHFWGLLHATAVTQGWNGYQNKIQHRTVA